MADGPRSQQLSNVSNKTIYKWIEVRNMHLTEWDATRCPSRTSCTIGSAIAVRPLALIYLLPENQGAKDAKGDAGQN